MKCPHCSSSLGNSLKVFLLGVKKCPQCSTKLKLTLNLKVFFGLAVSLALLHILFISHILGSYSNKVTIIYLAVCFIVSYRFKTTN